MRDWLFEKNPDTFSRTQTKCWRSTQTHGALGAVDRRLFLVICFLTEMLRGERETVIPGFLKHLWSVPVLQCSSCLLTHTQPPFPPAFSGTDHSEPGQAAPGARAPGEFSHNVTRLHGYFFPHFLATIQFIHLACANCKH